MMRLNDKFGIRGDFSGFRIESSSTGTVTLFIMTVLTLIFIKRGLILFGVVCEFCYFEIREFGKEEFFGDTIFNFFVLGRFRIGVFR